MSHPILERHLKQQTLRPLYLFFGEEEFLMQRALARLEAALTDRYGDPPVRVTREAGEVEPGEFLAEAREATLWGPGQLLVLRRVEHYGAPALKAFNDYLDHPAARSWVVLLGKGLKARDLAKVPVWSRLQREEAALGFFRLKEGELLQWLTQEAQAQGKTLTPAAAQRLVEIAGDNLAELSRELEKLVLFAGGEIALTPALVGQLASHSRTYSIFALVDALGAAGAHQRLAALDHLLDLGEPPAKVLGMLARQIRLLIRVRETGGDSPEAARRLNLPQGVLKRLGRQAAHFSDQALRAHLLALHQADLMLKTSTGNPRLVLEWALLKMGPG
jgi:DNA polymerase-3 subunit delta